MIKGISPHIWLKDVSLPQNTNNGIEEIFVFQHPQDWLEAEILLLAVQVLWFDEVQNVVFRSCMKKILEGLYLSNSPGVNDNNLVSSTTGSNNAFHGDIWREVLVFSSCREVEVENNFLSCVWLQGYVLALHILSLTQRHCTFGNLIEQAELLRFRSYIRDHHLACVGCARQELIRLSALLLLRALTDALLLVSVNDHDVVSRQVQAARLYLLLEKQKIAGSFN